MRFKNGDERTELLGSEVQADFFLLLIPFLMVAENPMIDGIYSAKKVVVQWIES